MKTKFIVRMLLVLFLTSALTVTFRDVSATSTVYWTCEFIDPNKVAYPGDTVEFWVRVTNLPESDGPLEFFGAILVFDPPLSATYGSFDFLFTWPIIPVGETRELLFGAFEWTYDVPVGYVQGGSFTLSVLEGVPEGHKGPYTVTIIAPTPVSVDVKPGSWPNPLKLKSKGVLPIAICGTEDFDVTTIDPPTIELTLEGAGVGVAPLRWSYEDVATPYTGEPCSGHDLKGDGYLDLTLKFKTQELIGTLGLDAFSDRDVVIIILTGNLKEEFGGTPFQGQDCIVILN